VAQVEGPLARHSHRDGAAYNGISHAKRLEDDKVASVGSTFARCIECSSPWASTLTPPLPDHKDRQRRYSSTGKLSDTNCR
jgi:hypothetical protein